MMCSVCRYYLYLLIVSIVILFFLGFLFLFFFFKQKTAYEMRISDWSSDVCSSDLTALAVLGKTTCVNGRGWERDDPKIGVRRARLVRGHAGLGRGYVSFRSRRRGQSVHRHPHRRQCDRRRAV